MNERELSLIKVLGEEFGQVITEMRESFSKSLNEHREAIDRRLDQIASDFSALKDAPEPDFSALVSAAVATIPSPELPALPDFSSMVQEAVSALPPPQDGKSITADDVRPMLQEMVDKAVGAIPAPENGRDYDPEVLAQAVKEAVDVAVSDIPVPQDGKSLTPEDVRPMLNELVTASMPVLPDVKTLVSEAVAALPAAEPGRDGRDALALEILPFIDEEKSYPRGYYATHNGGLWRSYEKTHGMRGWECVVDGVARVEIERADQRRFTLTVNRASGSSETRSFDVPVMLYRGVFKSGSEYQPGDTVTWGGSLWHCDEPTKDKPGETGSKGWTLAAKRGRDGRDKT
ncbi:phage gp6-like head-tail connector protein [Kosakonia radicincitans]|uniref:phage gp6-like head-tail connector protein n=1 Tax=Kosakonia radicincitans TaxID=283686 RepID=UPI0031D66E79